MIPKLTQEETEKLERGLILALQFVDQESETRWPTLDDICEIHRLLFGEYNPHMAGKYRRDTYYPAYIRFAVPQWHSVPAYMARLGDLLIQAREECNAVEDDEEQEDQAILWTARLHHRFERIHPFEDGNGRTGRAVATWILNHYDLPAFDVVREARDEYIDALAAADRALTAEDLFRSECYPHQTAALQPLVHFMISRMLAAAHDEIAQRNDEVAALDVLNPSDTRSEADPPGV